MEETDTKICAGCGAPLRRDHPSFLKCDICGKPLCETCFGKAPVCYAGNDRFVRVCHDCEKTGLPKRVTPGHYTGEM